MHTSDNIYKQNRKKRKRKIYGIVHYFLDVCHMLLFFHCPSDLTRERSQEKESLEFNKD